MELTLEQMLWLATLTPSERRNIIRKLATGTWRLVWSAAKHEYELIQAD